MDQCLNQPIKSLDPSQQEALEPSHLYAVAFSLQFEFVLERACTKSLGLKLYLYLLHYLCCQIFPELLRPHTLLEIV